MDKANKANIIGNILINEDEIAARAIELGRQITEDYAGKEIVLIGILRGAVPWMAELMKRIDLDMTIDFMACSSYGSATHSSGVVRINKDLDTNIEGKDIIIVEDIVDSGITLQYLRKYLENRGTNSIRICSLLDKPAGRRCDLEADYVGFTVDDMFIIGYGLDYDQSYRNLPYISYLDENYLEQME